MLSTRENRSFRRRADCSALGGRELLSWTLSAACLGAVGASPPRLAVAISDLRSRHGVPFPGAAL
jgi:hypothetical protein